MSDFDCDALPIPELNDRPAGSVEWAMHLPDFAEPEHIVADSWLVESAARSLGEGTLRITTEAGPTSERFYGARLSNTSWQPRLGNVFGTARDVPMVRTVAHDTESFEGRSTNWVVVNTNEVQDRIQEADYMPGSIMGAFVRPVDIETPDLHSRWTVFLNHALREGIRGLARERVSPDPRTIVDYVRVSAATRFAIVHSHRPFDDEPDFEPLSDEAASDEESSL